MQYVPIFNCTSCKFYSDSVQKRRDLEFARLTSKTLHGESLYTKFIFIRNSHPSKLGKAKIFSIELLTELATIF